MKKITLILCLCVAISAYAQNIVRCGTVTDYDGNVYQTVKIGTQCWMAENLRTTHYADGTEIFMDSNRVSNIIPYRYYPEKNEKNVPTYGFLYNWSAVMGGMASSNSVPSNVQGICPKGWHVPSNAELVILQNYVASQSRYQCDKDPRKIAKAFVSTTCWKESEKEYTPGYNSQDNNATGFSAMPAGGFNGNYIGFNTMFYSWTTTSISNIFAYLMKIWKDSPMVYIAKWKYCGENKGMACSVRCIRGSGELDIEELALHLRALKERKDRISQNAENTLSSWGLFFSKPADYSNPFLYPYLYPELVGAPSTSTSSDASSNSSTSSSTPTTSSQRVCPRCHGTGREDRDDAVCFGLDSKYCSECKKTVPCSHYHTTCTLCHGKGYY